MEGRGTPHVLAIRFRGYGIHGTRFSGVITQKEI